MTDRLTPQENAADVKANYEEACKMQRRRRSDLEREYVRAYLAEHPGAQPTDLVVCIYDMPPVETARIVTRPATAEEAAQLKIAECLVQAEEAFARWPTSSSSDHGIYRGLIQPTPEEF